MKKLVVLLIVLLVANLPRVTLGAPAKSKSVAWEYAFVKDHASRSTKNGPGQNAQTIHSYGVEIRLHRRAPIFLERLDNANSEAFLLDIFNRLGSKGWELITAPTHHGPNFYLLKRRK